MTCCRPSSKTHIRHLCDRIKQLEEELRIAEGRPATGQNAIAATSPTTIDSDSFAAVSEGALEDENHISRSPKASRSDSIIARLCGVQWQLNSDEGGQLHFFGPTSSLHLTESVSSSILHWGASTTKGERQVQDDVSLELQSYLMDVYWNYQNPVLQIVHREAFLNDMETGQTRYYSRLLLYCIFASAARISDRPEIRALAISADDDLEDEQPYLVKKATELLEHELKRPQITTIQSLQLLSVLDCAKSNDTKGWLYSGDACRLAFDLGLHRDCSGLTSANLTKVDLEARQIVFWGCFVFDRLWALYLGRPHYIKLGDVAVPRPGSQSDGNLSWEMRMAAAWTDIMEIVGHICDSLNSNRLTKDRLETLSKHLYEWHSKLHHNLRCDDGEHTPPSVYALHLQYYSALILLYRPSAGFGVATKSPATSIARTTCIQSAAQISRLLSEYERLHGHASSMSGVGLHTISNASTILIAEIADRRGATSSLADLAEIHQHFACLKRCIKSLSELEKSYLVARRVRKIIQLIMKLCNLGESQYLQHQSNTKVETRAVGEEQQQFGSRAQRDPLDPLPEEPSSGMLDHQNVQPDHLRDLFHGLEGTGISPLPLFDMVSPGQDGFNFDDAFPTTSQMDILYSFESFFGNG